MRRGNRKMKCLTIALFILLMVVPITAYGVDQPHDPSQSPAVDCGSCHWLSGAANDPAWATPGPGVDDTVNNKRCTQCHNGAPIMAGVTHSTDTTGSTLWAAQGGWRAECIDCHNPHYQRQNRKWGSASHITTGTVSSIAAGNATSNVILSAPLGSNYQGYYLIPNTGLNMILYKIKNPTSGSSNITVQGTVDTSLAAPGDTYAIVYAKNIKDSISYANPAGNTVGSANIKMFRPSGSYGPGDFANQPTSVCFACHTLPGSTPAANVLEHQSSTSCTASCHTHDIGFQKVIGGCSDCHGNPPGPVIFKNASGTNVVSDSPGAGAHNAHLVASWGMGCYECHSGGMSNPSAADNRVTIGFSLGGSNLGGRYDGKAGRNVFAYIAGNAATNVTTGNSYACQNQYCHSIGNLDAAGNPVAAGGNLYLTTPSWISGTNMSCSGCHGNNAANKSHPMYATGGGNTTTANNHVVHVETDAISCDVCHNTTTTSTAIPPTTIVQGGSHLNKQENVAIITAKGGINASYTANKVCNNVYCHGSNSDAWGTDRSTNATCTKCHGQLSTIAAYGADNALAAPGINGTGVDTNGNSAANDPQVGAHNIHLRGSANISVNIPCQTCHVVPATWAASNHNNTPAAAEITFNAAAAGNTGKPGTPYYDFSGKTCSNIYCHDSARFKNAYGGGNGYQPVWNNDRYLAGSGANLTISDCSKCHGFPPAGGHAAVADNNCYSCHTNIAGATNRAFVNAALHINGNLEAISACNGCHGASNNQDLSAGANTGHQIHFATATVATTQTQPSDFSTGYAYNCASCHPTTSHQNGANVPGVRTVDILGTKLTAYVNGSTNATDPRGILYGTNGTCTTVCHTRDGVAAAPVAAANWAGGKTGSCQICHKPGTETY
ncbi:MAG: CxxxxCH/CxxCH domain-containing protein, partial [Nitrospirae bacterium]|nr:CxxxxCH/CxxCH domain-containing protein [Nitrospirota bacterium]